METQEASRRRLGVDHKPISSCLSLCYDDYETFHDAYEAKDRQTRLSETLPPTPITPGFLSMEAQHKYGTQDKIMESIEFDDVDEAEHAGPANHQLKDQFNAFYGHNLKAPRQREHRRLILHSGSTKSVKSAQRSKLSSPSYGQCRPSLYDLANAAEYHRAATHNNTDRVSKKRYRIILKTNRVSKKHYRITLKKTVLPRTLNDQIKDSLIKAHQAATRADELLEEGIDGEYAGKK